MSFIALPLRLLLSRAATAWPALLLAALGLAGCAAPARGSAFDDTPGVLGSPAQARGGARKAEDSAPAIDQRLPPTALPGGQAALQTAEDAYTRGDWTSAAREFKALTTSYPRNGQVWFGYAASSALAGNLEEAATGFETVLRLDARDARAAYNLSLIRLSQAEVALSAAQTGDAPAPVRQQITRLARDLGPVFNRPAGDAPAGGASVGFRAQDPAREGAPATAASALLAPRAAANPPTPQGRVPAP